MAPPPPPPPPLPFGTKVGQGTKSNNFTPAPDRNALLSQIRKGTNLKKAQSHDRSAPAFDCNASSKPPPGGNQNSATCRFNGPSPLIPPGGLFPHGMPRLRPTVPRSGDSSSTHNDNPQVTLNRTDVSGSHSHPPSPASKVRQASGLHRSLTENAGNRNFPSDLYLKGPAPAPPPANLKPNLQDSNGPNRYPSVRRSVSQTSLGPKVRPARPPPNVKPPPPPKSTAALQISPVPPALPSKPPNVKRRQSFGVSDAQLSINMEGMRFSNNKTLVPPPPPRNNSVPNSLHQMPNSSPTTGHVSRMSIAPPPPPNRPASGVARVPSIRPVAPRARPPDPPLHSGHPAPPSLMKVMPSSHSVAPPPPTRVSSIKSSQSTEPISDLESRFFHKFHNPQSLPPPERFLNFQKSYPSRIIRQKSMQRLPPPPPPMSNLSAGRQHIGHQAMLHIQLESRVFANNTAHC